MSLLVSRKERDHANLKLDVSHLEYESQCSRALISPISRPVSLHLRNGLISQVRYYIVSLT